MLPFRVTREENSITDIRLFTQFQVTPVQTQHLKKKKKVITRFKRAPNFSSRKRKRNETKVMEEYCWAITQAAGPPCCAALKFLCQLHSLVSTDTVDQVRFAQNSTCARIVRTQLLRR